MRPPGLGLRLRGTAATVRATAPRIREWLQDFAEELQARGYRVQLLTSRPSEGLYTPRSWQRAAAAMTEGKLEYLELNATPSDGDSRAWATWRQPAQFAVAESDFGVLFGNPPLTDVAAFLARCLDLAELSGLEQGLMLSPGMPERLRMTLTPLEIKARFGPNALRRYVRGVGWGLWLTAGHLAGLGGRERVLKEAPVHRLVERPSGLWLELTADPFEVVPEEALARLERFLAPIFPTVEQVLAADRWEPEPSVGEAVTEADAYRDFAGPPVAHEWLRHVEEDMVGIHVQLEREPTPEVAAALERAVGTWHADWSVEDAEPGPLHDLLGPSWDEEGAHWNLDTGHADLEAALGDLMRRLAGWSARWECPVRVVRLGVEDL
jgi:hypothetical protein